MTSDFRDFLSFFFILYQDLIQTKNSLHIPTNTLGNFTHFYILFHPPPSPIASTSTITISAYLWYGCPAAGHNCPSKLGGKGHTASFHYLRSNPNLIPVYSMATARRTRPGFLTREWTSRYICSYRYLANYKSCVDWKYRSENFICWRTGNIPWGLLLE